VERRVKTWAWIVLFLLGSAHFSLAFISLQGKSVTVDEFGHLPVGVNILQKGDLRYAELNPPLMNVLSALPLLAMDVAPTAAAPKGKEYSFWANGYTFMRSHSRDYHRLFTAARTVTVVLVILFGILAFVWGRMLVPDRPEAAGLMAAGLLWLSPNLMAHGRLVTTDGGVSFFIALALFSLFLFARRPNVPRALLSGLTLGFALLAKFTAVYLFATHIVLLVLLVWQRREFSRRRLVLLTTTSYLAALFTINAGYLFQRTGLRASDYSFQSAPLSRLGETLPGAPLPLPEDFLRAFDRQLVDAGTGDPSYLFGEAYDGGRWYYFFAVAAAKIPVPLLLLGSVALVISLSGRGLKRYDELLILLPAALILVMFSFFSEKQLGLRMILPALTLIYLWIGATMARLPRPGRTGWAAGALFLWLALEFWRIHPDYLASFNQFAGGGSQGYRVALDSNLDWGQDLPRLRTYMQAKGLDSIQLLYFGRVDPSVYGIAYEVPRGKLKPGYLVLSRSLLGRSYLLNDHGRFHWAGPFEIAPSSTLTHLTTLGHSLDIYHVR